MSMSDLGDRFIRALDGSASAGEREQLRQDLNIAGISAAQVQDWTRPGTTDLQFGIVYARQGIFDISPTDNLSLLAGAPQSIQNDKETPLDFSIGTPSKSTNYLRFDVATPTQIFVNVAANRQLMIYGTSSFATAAAGRRALTVKEFDINDTQILGYTLYSMLPTGIAIDTYPFCTMIKVSPTTSYIVAYLYQNSGGTINGSAQQFEISIVR